MNDGLGGQMSPTDSELLREAIRRVLAPPTGSGPGAWNRLQAVLAPVIGARGYEALFSRALHLASTRFPWRAATGTRAPLKAFVARLEAREPSAASETSEAMLATVAELLATLVGPLLSERLLAPMRAEHES